MDTKPTRQDYDALLNEGGHLLRAEIFQHMANVHFSLAPTLLDARRKRTPRRVRVQREEKATA